MKRIFKGLVLAVIFGLLSLTTVSAKGINSQYNEQTIALYESFKDEVSYEDFVKLEEMYRSKSSILENKGYGIKLSLDEFIEEYCQNNAEGSLDHFDMNDWVQPRSKEKFQVAPLSSSGSNAWYYNTGVGLPQVAYYECTRMLSVLKRGDIMYENDGVTNGLVGHIGLVEGKYYSNARHCYYIRLVEAISPGVCRSVIDDERWSVKGSRFFRPTSYNSTIAENAVTNALSQLGKAWAIHAMVNGSSSAGTWYCSELVWWSYYCAGVNFFNSSVAYPYSTTLIYPTWFTNSSNLREISVN